MYATKPGTGKLHTVIRGTSTSHERSTAYQLGSRHKVENIGTQGHDQSRLLDNSKGHIINLVLQKEDESISVA